MSARDVKVTREEAMREYALAWTRWRAALPGSDVRAYAEAMMDAMQPVIADGPNDPRWAAFTATLPGFTEYWESALDVRLARLGRPPASGEGS